MRFRTPGVPPKIRVFRRPEGEGYQLAREWCSSVNRQSPIQVTPTQEEGAQEEVAEHQALED